MAEGTTDRGEGGQSHLSRERPTARADAAAGYSSGGPCLCNDPVPEIAYSTASFPVRQSGGGGGEKFDEAFQLGWQRPLECCDKQL